MPLRESDFSSANSEGDHHTENRKLVRALLKASGCSMFDRCAADGMIVAAPVYNYDVSAAAKNMIELTGSAWEDKVVGFLCAAGGMNSYMSVMAYANSLMLDFRTVIIPRFVYATGDAFDGDKIVDKKVVARIEQVADELVRFTEALRG